MPTAEILSQGDEVVTGQTADTNAQWLSEQLTGLGFDVTRHGAVGDRLDDIVGQLHEAASRSDVAISTGGLGPTEDDLTAQAVATAFECPLALDEEALEHIKALYARFQRRMPKVNEKQAWLPSGCQRLDNSWGTAPGFALDVPRDGGSAFLAFLPGVPSEMKKLFAHRVLPELQSRFAVQPGILVTLRTTGIGESNLQERIGDLGHDNVVLSYRTKLPENHVKLRFPPDTAEATIDAVATDVRDRIGSPVFVVERPGQPGGSLVEVIARHLIEREQTLSTAESCTGGGVSAMCTSISGSSAWFLEGAVTYSNAAKVRQLGIDPALIEANGAVSEPVARAMAEGIRAASGSTWGLSTTGIAGPSGGTPDKPVGTVHIAVAGPDDTLHRQLRLGGHRHRIQALSVAGVLDLLRRRLQGLL